MRPVAGRILRSFERKWFMNRYTIPKCSGDSADWKDVPEVRIAYNLVESPFPVQASAQMCWSESAIHVLMTAQEEPILARFTGNCDPVCHDSCLEIFLSPIVGDMRYFNFEFNPNGACYFGFGSGRENLMRLHPWDLQKLLSVKTWREGNRWGVCFDIPLETIRLFMPEFTLYEGRRMRGNFYKCCEDLSPTHELVWNPITNGVSDFHQPEFFGELVLG